ncbi:MAG: permease [Thermoleophilaceae bacterium]|jgi:GABA permease|nr:permease [Thermoleophilaceae bacterium]
MTPRDRTAHGRFRILVIANETLVGEGFHDFVTSHAVGRPVDVLIVAPALNSRLRHWMSDGDGARRNAEERLERSLGLLADAGIAAYGWVGDADPLAAIEDALAIFTADQLIISTHPEERSNWLARDVVGRARERFGLPLAHVVVGSGVRDDQAVVAVVA